MTTSHQTLRLPASDRYTPDLEQFGSVKELRPCKTVTLPSPLSLTLPLSLSLPPSFFHFLLLSLLFLQSSQLRQSEKDLRLAFDSVMRCVLEFRSDGEWAMKPIEVKGGGGREGGGRGGVKREEGEEEGIEGMGGK